MKFTTNKITWTDAMKDFAVETVNKKLDRLIDDCSNASITLSKINNASIKVTLSLGAFRAQAVGSDFYAAMTDVAVKLKSIVTKHKKKYNKAKEAAYSIAETAAEFEDSEEDTIADLVSKEKIFDLKPISLEEAIMEFEQTDYPFYVYKDADDKNTITIVYRRFGDTYGLIRCH